MVADFCYHWSMRQGWFQFSSKDKMPGGKSIVNRDGSRTLKAKGPKSLAFDASLKPYDENK